MSFSGTSRHSSTTETASSSSFRRAGSSTIQPLRRKDSFGVAAPAVTEKEVASHNIINALFGSKEYTAPEVEWPSDPLEKAKIFNKTTHDDMKLRHYLFVGEEHFQGGDIDGIVDAIKSTIMIFKKSNFHVLRALKRFFFAIRVFSKLARKRAIMREKILLDFREWWEAREEELRDDYYSHVADSTYRYHHTLKDTVEEFQRTCTPQEIKDRVVRMVFHRHRIHTTKLLRGWDLKYQLALVKLYNYKEHFGGTEKNILTEAQKSVLRDSRKNVERLLMERPEMQFGVHMVSIKQLLTVAKEVEDEMASDHQKKFLNEWETQRDEEREKRREWFEEHALKREEEYKARRKQELAEQRQLEAAERERVTKILGRRGTRIKSISSDTGSGCFSEDQSLDTTLRMRASHKVAAAHRASLENVKFKGKRASLAPSATAAKAKVGMRVVQAVASFKLGSRKSSLAISLSSSINSPTLVADATITTTAPPTMTGVEATTTSTAMELAPESTYEEWEAFYEAKEAAKAEEKNKRERQEAVRRIVEQHNAIPTPPLPGLHAASKESTSATGDRFVYKPHASAVRIIDKKRPESVTIHEPSLMSRALRPPSANHSAYRPQPVVVNPYEDSDENEAMAQSFRSPPRQQCPNTEMITRLAKEKHRQMRVGTQPEKLSLDELRVQRSHSTTPTSSGALVTKGIESPLSEQAHDIRRAVPVTRLEILKRKAAKQEEVRQLTAKTTETFSYAVSSPSHDDEVSAASPGIAILSDDPKVLKLAHASFLSSKMKRKAHDAFTTVMDTSVEGRTKRSQTPW